MIADELYPLSYTKQMVMLFVTLAFNIEESRMSESLAPDKKNIDEWIALFKAQSIPVLRQTAKTFEALKKEEDDISPREICEGVYGDPLMILKVLNYAQTHKGKHQIQDLLQADQAILMMGTGTFFRELQPTLLVESVLSKDLKAMTYLLKLIRRLHRASFYAAEFAIFRKDMHHEEIRVAALLHDMAEVLMWCFASDEMRKIAHIQQTHKDYRSAEVQKAVLGFDLHDLQMQLIKEFTLPPLLLKLMDDNYAEDNRVKNVVLAVNVARHSANGWDDAALPDDYEAIARFLRIDQERTKRLLRVPQETFF